MKKRKPAYLKIIQGMQCCYGSEDRNCADCPYDRYNDRDFYGLGTAYCMEKLNEAAKKWADSMEMFCYCGDCMCYRPETDPVTWKSANHGHCSTWDCDVLETEYCSRGGMRDE